MAGNNKVFVSIGIFLVGLLVLGLLAVGGMVALGSINRAQQAAEPTGTSTLPAVAKAPTPTLTRPPSPTLMPSNTSLPTITNTPVVKATLAPEGDVGGQAESAGPVTPSHTPAVVATPVSEQSTPDTGIGGLEALLIAAGLIGVLFITRRLRRAR